MKISIPQWSYLEEYDSIRDDVLAACDRVFRSGRLILGEEGQSFENKLAASVGVAGAVGVGNGTDAIFIALASLGIKAGDEIITVPNTAVPTVSAIETIGAIPVFVDIGEDCLMDPAQIESRITPRTRAIIPVHLFGQMADMETIMSIARRHNLLVIEDVAQAQGASQNGQNAGSIGDASAFSFYPTKVLGGYGDSGAVASNDFEVLKLARSLRFYGMDTAYYAERKGYNSRMDEIQAAILSLKLPFMEAGTERRRAIAARYDAAFAGSLVSPVKENQGNRHVYHLYVVEADDRDALMSRLGEAGIGTGICYPWPIHIMRGYSHLGYHPEDFPVAMRKAGRIFNLPIYSEMKNNAVDYVIEAILKHG